MPQASRQGPASLDGAGLQVLLDQLPEAVMFVDPSGQVLLSNRADELPPPPVALSDLGETFVMYRPDGASYKTPDWPILRSARTGQVIVAEEFVRRGAGGARRSFTCRCAPFYDDQGHIQGAVSIEHDITHGKRLEQQVAYLLAMLEHTDDAILELDARWSVMAWNKGAQRGQRRRGVTLARRDGSGVDIESVRQAERNRIARELHDDGLRELNDALGLVVARAGSADPAEEQRWAAVRGALQRLGEQLRSAIYDLRLGMDEERDFAERLEELVARHSALSGDCKIELHGAKRLPPESLGHGGTEALRIIREAITNARLHSGAGTIGVDAGRSDAEVLRLDVTDDGSWARREAAIAARSGTGIIGMLERADLLGAELRVESGPCGGTTVSLEWPLKTAGPT